MYVVQVTALEYIEGFDLKFKLYLVNVPLEIPTARKFQVSFQDSSFEQLQRYLRFIILLFTVSKSQLFPNFSPSIYFSTITSPLLVLVHSTTLPLLSLIIHTLTLILPSQLLTLLYNLMTSLFPCNLLSSYYSPPPKGITRRQDSHHYPSS